MDLLRNNFTLYINTEKGKFNRCLAYNSIRDWHNDYCVDNVDKKVFITNCTHNSLFLCQDQSRCLPNKFKCDGIIQCIDASDEIEHCKYPNYFRYFKFNQVIIESWFNFLIFNHPDNSLNVIQYDAKTLIKEGTKFIQKHMFGLKCV